MDGRLSDNQRPGETAIDYAMRVARNAILREAASFAAAGFTERRHGTPYADGRMDAARAVLELIT